MNEYDDEQRRYINWMKHLLIEGHPAWTVKKLLEPYLPLMNTKPSAVLLLGNWVEYQGRMINQPWNSME